MPARRAPGAGRPPKPLEEKLRLGNPGGRPLPKPITAIRPVEVEVSDETRPPQRPGTGRSPHAGPAPEAGIGETDAIATLRLVLQGWDERERLRAVIEEAGHTQVNEKGVVIARPEVAMLRELERSLTAWFSQLGLNPADRGRLGLAQVQAKATGLAALRQERALKAGRPAG